MSEDTYAGFAERYDWMLQDDPERKEFFKQVFARHGICKVLDCACGTGHDLIMFHSLGCAAFGSDLSGAMLVQAQKNLSSAGIEVPLLKADFRYLPDTFDEKFDAVVCLTNSINEVLTDDETVQALHSIKSVLREGGILIFDQGQSDASMNNPPKYNLVVNERDWTRFFALEYLDNVMTVNIFDFIHSKEKSGYEHARVDVRIRLQDSWTDLLKVTGFCEVEFFEDWDCNPYSKDTSMRMIVVAK